MAGERMREGILSASAGMRRRIPAWYWFTVAFLAGFLILLLSRWMRTRPERSEIPLTMPEEKPAPADDLTVIEGIGPKIAAWLGEAGISSFAQLAAADPRDLAAILHARGFRLANPATWPQQAALAARGDWEELAKLKTRLKGGREPS